MLTYVNRGTVTLRTQPDRNSDVESTAIYGQPLTVVSNQGEWSLVRAQGSNVNAYIRTKYLTSSSLDETLIRVSSFRAFVYGEAQTDKGPIMEVPFGTRFNVLERADPRFVKILLLNSTIAYVPWAFCQFVNISTISDLATLARDMATQRVPFTMGGCTSFAVDSSGLIKFLFEQINITLPHSVRQQFALDMWHPVSKDDLMPGDLLFVGESETKISRVAMVVGNNELVHATVAPTRAHVSLTTLKDNEWNGNDSRYPYVTFRRLDDNRVVDT